MENLASQHLRRVREEKGVFSLADDESELDEERVEESEEVEEFGVRVLKSGIVRVVVVVR